jgi:adenosine/AMP kinase
LANLDFVTLFLSFLFAFIVKDFYDIFIQNHIKKWLSKYKIYITSTNSTVNKKIVNVAKEKGLKIGIVDVHER